MRSAFKYSNELKAVIDKRQESYKAGKAKMLTAAESKKRIQEVLRTGQKTLPHL